MNSYGTPGSGWLIQGINCSSGGNAAACGSSTSGGNGKIYISY